MWGNNLCDDKFCDNKTFLDFQRFYFSDPNILKTLLKSGCVFNGFLRVSEILKSQISFSDKLSV